MIIPAQLRIGTWVELYDGTKKYIGDVDHHGNNPDNMTKMFALYLSDEEGGFGQWVPAAEVQSVHGKNPYKGKEDMGVVDLGVASYQANKAGSIADNVKPEGRFMLKRNIKEAKQCNWCGHPLPSGGQYGWAHGDFCSSKCEKNWEKMADSEADYKDPSLTTKQKQASWKKESKLNEGLENQAHSILKKARLVNGEDYEIKYDKGKMQIHLNPPALEKTAWQALKRAGMNVRWISNGVLGFESRIAESKLEAIQGGKGQDVDTKDVDQDQLRVGIAVEMEHTSDQKVAAEIALDHLAENPNYYTELVDTGIADESDAIEIAKKTGVSKKKGIVPVAPKNQQQPAPAAPAPKAAKVPPKPKSAAPAVREGSDDIRMCKCGHSRRDHLTHGKPGRNPFLPPYSRDCHICDCKMFDEVPMKKEGDRLLHHARPGKTPPKPKTAGSTPTAGTGAITFESLTPNLDADQKQFASKVGTVVTTRDGKRGTVKKFGYLNGLPAWMVQLQTGEFVKVDCLSNSIVGSYNKKKEVYAGIDEPARLGEMVDDVKILNRINKLRDEIQKLQRTASKDAYGDQKKIKKMGDEIRDLEHKLYSELDLGEGTIVVDSNARKYSPGEVIELISGQKARVIEPIAVDRLLVDLQEHAMTNLVRGALVEDADVMITTDNLMYNSARKTFSTELGDIRTGGRTPRAIFVKNPKTGNRVEFRFAKTETDHEHEVQSFIYKSVDGKYTLELFND